MHKADAHSSEAEDIGTKDPENRKGSTPAEPKSFDSWWKVFLWITGGLLAIAQLINEIIDIFRLF